MQAELSEHLHDFITTLNSMSHDDLQQPIDLDGQGQGPGGGGGEGEGEDRVQQRAQLLGVFRDLSRQRGAFF